MMRYQEEDKGLFTFYREQQQEEEKHKYHKQNQQIDEEPLKQQDNQIEIKKQNRVKSQYFHTDKLKPNTNNNQDQLEKDKQPSSLFRQYGSSVIVINPKQKHQQQQSANNPKQSNSKSPVHQNGHYLQNKQIQFSPSPKARNRGKPFNHRKNPFVNKKIQRSESLKPHILEDSPRRQLPPLIKNQQQSPYKTQIKKIPLPLKSNGSDFVRQLKNKIILQMNDSASDRHHSVSFIQYNRDCLRASQIKKGEPLTPQQKRVLELLYRYRSPIL